MYTVPKSTNEPRVHSPRSLDGATPEGRDATLFTLAVHHQYWVQEVHTSRITEPVQQGTERQSSLLRTTWSAHAALHRRPTAACSLTHTVLPDDQSQPTCAHLQWSWTPHQAAETASSDETTSHFLTIAQHLHTATLMIIMYIFLSCRKGRQRQHMVNPAEFIKQFKTPYFTTAPNMQWLLIFTHLLTSGMHLCLFCNRHIINLSRWRQQRLTYLI